MTLETNKAMIQRLYADGFNHQDADAAAAFYAPDAVNHGMRIGRDGMRQIFSALFSLFPDLTYATEDCTAEADRVVCKVLMSATHLGRTDSRDIYAGKLAGVRPTGKAVRVLQFHSFRIDGDHIVEHVAVRDDLGMLRQLGIID